MNTICKHEKKCTLIIMINNIMIIKIIFKTISWILNKIIITIFFVFSYNDIFNFDILIILGTLNIILSMR